MKQSIGKSPLPEGIIELPLKPVKIQNASRILAMGDTHIGFHDKRAIDVTLAFGKKMKVNCICLMGDILDIYQGSRFSHDSSISRLMDELRIAKEWLAYLRKTFPAAQIFFYEGNHEQRMTKYVQTHAPILNGTEYVTLQTMLELKRLGITWVTNGTGMKINQLHLLHGNEAGVTGGINVGRSMLLKTFDNCAFWNFHKTQESPGKTLDGDEFANWAVGCLCGLKPQYLPINSWNLGFAYIETFKDEFEFSNKKILSSSYNIR